MAETADHLPGTPPTAAGATARLPWYRVLGRATSRMWVGCAVALIATAAAVAGLHPWSLAAAYAVMLVVAIAAAMVDAIELRLQDPMTYPILAAGIDDGCSRDRRHPSGAGRAVLDVVLYRRTATGRRVARPTVLRTR